MPFRELSFDVAGADPTSVVGDNQPGDAVTRDSSILTLCAPACLTTLVSSSRAAARRRPSADVRRDSSHCSASMAHVEMPSFGGTAGQVSQSRKKSGLVQYRRVELRHERTQQLGRFEQRVIDPVEGSRIRRVARLVKVLTGGQHVLQGTVVEVL